MTSQRSSRTPVIESRIRKWNSLTKNQRKLTLISACILFFYIVFAIAYFTTSDSCRYYRADKACRAGKSIKTVRLISSLSSDYQSRPAVKKLKADALLKVAQFDMYRGDFKAARDSLKQIPTDFRCTDTVSDAFLQVAQHDMADANYKAAQASLMQIPSTFTKYATVSEALFQIAQHDMADADYKAAQTSLMRIPYTFTNYATVSEALLQIAYHNMVDADYNAALDALKQIPKTAKNYATVADMIERVAKECERIEKEREAKRIAARKNTTPARSQSVRKTTAALPNGAYRISPGTWIGATDKEHFKTISSYLFQKDREALQKALDVGFITGECTVFAEGEVVFLIKAETIFAGRVRLRRQGETTEYWTFMESIL